VVTGRKNPSRRNDPRDSPDDAVARILVVEDDLDLGETVCEVLKMSGYRASHAVDGLVALQMLGQGEGLPDLILLDLMMPRMDGWAFREAQLRDKKLKDIPVVVVSAMGEIAKPIKADHVLRKPIEPETLLQTIQNLIRRRSGRSNS
jgi:two-component system, chemotaxis family, chemotaxis protein CheY